MAKIIFSESILFERISDNLVLLLGHWGTWGTFLGHLGHSSGALGALTCCFWGTWGTHLGHLGHSFGALGALFLGTWGTWVTHQGHFKNLLRALGMISRDIIWLPHFANCCRNTFMAPIKKCSYNFSYSYHVHEKFINYNVTSEGLQGKNKRFNWELATCYALPCRTRPRTTFQFEQYNNPYVCTSVDK